MFVISCFVYQIMWTKFRNGGLIGVKLSRVARLVSSSFWVGRTPAKSPPGSTWLATSPFVSGGAARSSVVLGATGSYHTILESSCQAKQHCSIRFLFLSLGPELQVLRGGGGNFLRIS